MVEFENGQEYVLERQSDIEVVERIAESPECLVEDVVKKYFFGVFPDVVRPLVDQQIVFEKVLVVLNVFMETCEFVPFLGDINKF